MSVLETNLAALRGRASELAACLAHTPVVNEAHQNPETAAETPPLPALQLLPARSGELTARCSAGWLHSRYDPKAEARRVAREALQAGQDLMVCLGFGLGYLPEACLAEGTKVLVIEQDALWLRSCLAARPLPQLLQDSRLAVALCPDGEALLSVLHELQPGRIAVSENPLFADLFPETTLSYRSALQQYQNKERINVNTLKRFGRLWVRNTIRNAGHFAGTPGVASLEGCCKGLPALVLAAGPSLDEILPHIYKLRESCVIIAVDTALRSLLRFGIEPDFLIVVDPQLYNSWHLQFCTAASSILVSEAAVWPAVLRAAYRGIYLCSSMYPLGKLLEERSGLNKGKLGAGGSVATTAWDFARLLGCTTLYMAGLDLSFPGGRTHAQASLFEQRALNAGQRLKPAASALFQAALGGQPYRDTANDGSSVITDKRLSLYAWWYTRTLAKYPELPTWNLSSRGLAIAGMPACTLESLFSLKSRRPQIDQAITQAHDTAYAQLRSSTDGERFENAYRSLLNELSEIEGLAAEAVQLSAQLVTLLETSADNKAPAAALAAQKTIQQQLERLDAIDREVLQSKAKDVAGFLYPDLAEQVGARSQSLAESIRKTADIYRTIHDSAVWHKKIMEEHVHNYC